MSKIEELTPEQEKLLPVYRDKWTKIGLSMEPADRPRTEAGIVKAYEAAELVPPKEIIWCNSSPAQEIAKAKSEKSVWGSAKANVWASVGANIWVSVWASVKAAVSSEVWDIVHANIRRGVWASVKANRGIVESGAEARQWAVVCGQHDAHLIGVYDYFREVLGLTEETEKLQGAAEVCRSAGWWLPHENICWVSERGMF